jgi:Lhr-like helicase
VLYELLRALLKPLGMQGRVAYHHASASVEHRRIVENGFKNETYLWVIAADLLGMGADIRGIVCAIQVRAQNSVALTGSDSEEPAETAKCRQRASYCSSPR